MRNRIVIILICCFGLLSCSHNGPDAPQTLMEEERMSLNIDGQTVLIYDSLNWQWSCNKQRRRCIVMSDDVSDFFLVSFSTLPSKEGQDIRADIRWSVKGSVSTKKHIPMSVERISPEGKVWLWSPSNRLGFSVMIAE